MTSEISKIDTEEGREWLKNLLHEREVTIFFTKKRKVLLTNLIATMTINVIMVLMENVKLKMAIVIMIHIVEV